MGGWSCHIAVRQFWWAALGLLAVSCTTTAPVASVDAGPSISKPGFGQTCDPAEGCTAGLVCLEGDFAPKPWCTATCPAAKVKAYCDDPALGGAPALCIQMPADFQGPSTPFCAPICANLAACQPLSGQWEVCSKPEYKKKVLTTDLPTKVCLAPSAHGQLKVDPILCDWEDKVVGSVLVAAAQQCKALCKSLLIPCQYWPKGQSEACCGWACMQHVTPGGQLDNDLLSKEIKCLVQSVASYRGTPLMCVGWKDQNCPMPEVLNPDGK